MARLWTWTAEAKAHAGKLWCDGFSASQIAGEMGCSRNAVIGIATRNRDLFPMKAGGQNGQSRRRTHLRRATPARPSMRLPKLSTAPMPELPPMPAPRPVFDERTHMPVGFSRLTESQCRWPLTGLHDPAGADMPCCGLPVVDPLARDGTRERTHCAFHLAASAAR